MYLSIPLILGAGLAANCVVLARQINIRSDAGDSSNQGPLVMYVADQERGILSVEFDSSKPVQSSLSILATNTDGGTQPGWLTSHDNKIYSVSRTQFPTVNSTSGDVYSFQPHNGESKFGAKDSRDFGLTPLSNMSSEGKGSVACAVSKDGHTIAVANIDGSSISVHPLSNEGTIGQATYVFNYPNPLAQPGPGTNGSQEQSNPHEAIFDPSGKYMFSPDRGADLLRIYSVASPWDVSLIQTISLLSGSGPRHLTFRVFNATRTYMYLVSELDNTVRVFTLDYPIQANASPSQLDITLRQIISTMGADQNRTSPNNNYLAAEIALSADGRFAYASTRNTQSLDSDTLAIFAVHPELEGDEAHLTYMGENLTYGKIPRHFALSKDKASKYAAIGNEVSGNIMVLERDENSGWFTALKGNLTLNDFDEPQKKGPTAVLWA